MDDIFAKLADYPDARLAYHFSPRSKWSYATVANRDPTTDYNHRDVLPHEVVVDLDADTEEENFQTLKKIVKRLSANGHKYSVWSTGGKGYHIHTFWDIVNVAEPRFLREKIHEYIVKGIEGKYDTQLLGKHLVRLEGGLYEKAYPKTPRKSIVAKAGELFEKNTVPECVWNDYRESILKIVLNNLTRKPGIPHNGGVRLCMKHIMSPEFKTHKDGGKRALFVVASYYRGLPDNELFTIINSFNNYNLKERYTKRQIETVVRSVREHPGRPVGCKFRHELLRAIGAGGVADECESLRDV